MAAEPVSLDLLARGDWPERARVRGEAPLGIGTPWVEAASGVLVHTAALNRLAVRPFLERVLSDAVGGASTVEASTAEIASLARELVKRPGASVNGGGITARTWVAILGEATRQPGLAQTTTIRWAGHFSARGLLHAYRAYCPVCLHYWVRGETPLGPVRAWEPLRWQFRALEACVTHGVRLRTECLTPGCGRRRAVIAGWASTERCVGCRVAFGRLLEEVRASEVPLSTEELDWAAFVDTELGDIVARPPADRGGEPASWAEILAVAIESVTGGAQGAFARSIGMTEGTVSYWKDGRRTPTLDAILRVCRAAGFRLRDVLEGDLEAIRASSTPVTAPYVSPSRETHVALDADEMERILRAALVADPPPTLASVYADTRVNQTHVRRRFPRLCADVRERRAAWVKAERAAVRADRIRQIEDAVASLSAAGIYPSRNHIRQLLPAPWFRRDDFAEAWRKAVMAAGWGDPSDLARVRGRPSPVPVRLRPMSAQAHPVADVASGSGASADCRPS